MKPFHRAQAAALLCLVAGLATWVLTRPSDVGPATGPARNSNEALTTSATARPATPTPPVPDHFPAALRPLAVAHASDRHEWTAADGRDPVILAQLAHNALEYQRLLEENDRIFRRQLVYRRETAAAAVQQARAAGQPLTHLVLPDFDGREHLVEITHSELHPSGLAGQFGGRLAGHPDSMVTLAFQVGREAFTILAPSAGIFLQADPREPGEILLKHIDPATYVVGVCGNP
jgi:hypothetical protein